MAPLLSLFGAAITAMTVLLKNRLQLGLVVLLLGGCATFSPDGGFDTVETIAKERLNKDVVWVKKEADIDISRNRIQELLKNPLSADEAVQIALLNNAGLQAAYSELGIAEANLVQAGRIPNPSFSFERLKRGDELEYERRFTFNLLGLLVMPIAKQIEQRRFNSAKLDAAQEVFMLAGETRRAWIAAVAAQETAKYLEEVVAAAETSRDLAQRMRQVGNWGKINLAREQLFYAESTAQLARAKQNQIAQRERLTRLMGLWGNDIAFKLPERLPELPATSIDRPDVESQAMAQRLDIQILKLETEGLAKSLGLTKATRFINVLEVGYQRNSETDKPRQTGYEIELQLPLFDWGSAKVAKAEALYMQAIHHARETAINARSEIREAYQNYRGAYDLAKHYRDEIVPLRKTISDEQLLRYNGMLIGVFELISDARDQVMTVNTSINALRDFWLAEAELQQAMLGRMQAKRNVMMDASTPTMNTSAAH